MGVSTRGIEFMAYTRVTGTYGRVEPKNLNPEAYKPLSWVIVLVGPSTVSVTSTLEAGSGELSGSLGF